MNRKTTNNAAIATIDARERCSGLFQRISESADPTPFRATPNTAQAKQKVTASKTAPTDNRNSAKRKWCAASAAAFFLSHCWIMERVPCSMAIE